MITKLICNNPNCKPYNLKDNSVVHGWGEADVYNFPENVCKDTRHIDIFKETEQYLSSPRNQLRGQSN